MSKHQKRPSPQAKSARSRRGIVAAVVLIIAGGGALALINSGKKPASAPPVVAPGADTNTLPAMETAQSVVVVTNLGFGKQPPVLEDVLRDIERRSQSEDGGGRTFAILEAFTQPDFATGDLNLCLRVSTEKPGLGEIIFRRTGQTNSLWKTRVIPASKKPTFTGGSLSILFDNGDGKIFTVDGSTGPPSIFEAMLKEAAVPVNAVWPQGEVREFSFIYSSCGCPIKVKCRREGDRTIRTESATQVIFPDDPAVVQIISRLMRW